MNGPKLDVADIMAKINCLSPRTRAKVLGTLGREVEVATAQTNSELREKAAQAYHTAVEALQKAIPEGVNWSWGGYEYCCGELENPRHMLVNRMTGHMFRELQSEEITRFKQAAENYRKQVAVIESDPDSCDFNQLSHLDLATLLATSSEKLSQNGTLAKVAEIAKEKVLAMPLAPPQRSESLNFRKHFTSASTIEIIVKFAPVRSQEEGVELLRRIQPQGYLVEGYLVQYGDGVKRVSAIFEKFKVRFSEMVGDALLTAPEWVMDIIMDNFSKWGFAKNILQLTYMLAKISITNDRMADRIRQRLANIDTSIRECRPVPLEMFNYWVESFQALQQCRVLPQVDHYFWGQMPLAGFDGREHRLTQKDAERQGLANMNDLVRVLAWEELLNHYQNDTPDFKKTIRAEILRQLNGEPTHFLLKQADTLDEARLSVLREILLADKKLREKFWDVGAQVSSGLKKDNLEYLKVKLGYYAL